MRCTGDTEWRRGINLRYTNDGRYNVLLSPACNYFVCFPTACNLDNEVLRSLISPGLLSYVYTYIYIHIFIFQYNALD